MWRAASLAIEQANAAGGYQGRPFKLIAGWSENPWGTGVKELARMVYEDKVWAIIGGIDGPSTHLAEQVVAKARLPLLSGANADRTANLANVPWMFSLLPGQPLQAAALVDVLASALKADGRLVMISSTDHDSHIFSMELNKCLDRHHIMMSYHYEIKPNRAHDQSLIGQVIKSHSNAVIIAADVRDSAQLVLGLRQAGFTGLLFGGPCMSRQAFIHLAGNAAEGVIFPLLYESSPESPFEKAFRHRFGRQGDYLSAHTYDTVTLLVEAIRTAGLDRQAIRDQVARLSPWQGVTGSVTWDEHGSNIRSVPVGTIKKGKVTPIAGFQTKNSRDSTH